MLAIRMQRNGREHYSTYRIIVQEAQRHPLSGRVVAEVGFYNPHTKEITLDKEAVKKYLKNGAQPSTRVIRILKAQKITLPKWVKEVPKKSSKAKHADKLRKNQPKDAAPAEAAAEPVAEEAAASETPAEAPTDAPAEEKAEETPAAE